MDNYPREQRANYFVPFSTVQPKAVEVKFVSAGLNYMRDASVY
jgi:hypothetical protein